MRTPESREVHGDISSERPPIRRMQGRQSKQVFLRDDTRQEVRMDKNDQTRNDPQRDQKGGSQGAGGSQQGGRPGQGGQGGSQGGRNNPGQGGSQSDPSRQGGSQGGSQGGRSGQDHPDMGGGRTGNPGDSDRS